MSTQTITYTFSPDCPVDALRGVTLSGGELCRIDGQWQTGEPDAVRFERDGKLVLVRIAGKPELEAVLMAAKASAAAKTATLGAMHWPEYKAALTRAANARAAYDRASEQGYPIRQAEVARVAEAALDQARTDYPEAALYALACAYADAAHDVKSAAGRAAMTAIESGADPAQSVAAMIERWRAACGRAVTTD